MKYIISHSWRRGRIRHYFVKFYICKVVRTINLEGFGWDNTKGKYKAQYFSSLAEARFFIKQGTKLHIQFKYRHWLPDFKIEIL